ncbi:hypothetical protein CMV_021886 [Castanea mollissima]|uniref:Uncharacterized protein n=1 Tax=Castanea mollissima TaxID=60419 RepID=A0A8J4V8N6_9ROSI|nr:hypothetical protein CMV_021886 [Castanea mollissima]
MSGSSNHFLLHRPPPPKSPSMSPSTFKLKVLFIKKEQKQNAAAVDDAAAADSDAAAAVSVGAAVPVDALGAAVDDVSGAAVDDVGGAADSVDVTACPDGSSTRVHGFGRLLDGSRASISFDESNHDGLGI